MPIINDQSLTALCERDKIFADIIKLYDRPQSWEREPGFETLARIILEQQVSLESAFAAYTQLKGRLGAFTPENLLLLTDAEMRTAYISRQKTRYLRELAKAVTVGTLDFSVLPKLSAAEAKTELTKIVGIGNWTAEVYLMFCLQSPDIFPAGDIAAVNTVKELKGATDKEVAVQIAAQWSPFRTAATFLLWHYYLCRRGRRVDY